MQVKVRRRHTAPRATCFAVLSRGGSERAQGNGGEKPATNAAGSSVRFPPRESTAAARLQEEEERKLSAARPLLLPPQPPRAYLFLTFSWTTPFLVLFNPSFLPPLLDAPALKKARNDASDDFCRRRAGGALARDDRPHQVPVVAIYQYLQGTVCRPCVRACKRISGVEAPSSFHLDPISPRNLRSLFSISHSPVVFSTAPELTVTLTLYPRLQLSLPITLARLQGDFRPAPAILAANMRASQRALDPARCVGGWVSAGVDDVRMEASVEERERAFEPEKGSCPGKVSRLYPLALPAPALLRAPRAEALEQLGNHLERYGKRASEPRKDFKVR